MASDNADKGESVSTVAQREALDLNDMLSGLPIEGSDYAGAWLKFQPFGDSTRISIEADAPSAAAPKAVLTLTHVAGKTLQELLNEISPTL